MVAHVELYVSDSLREIAVATKFKDETAKLSCFTGAIVTVYSESGAVYKYPDLLTYLLTSSQWHSTTDWWIETPMDALTATTIPLHRVEIAKRFLWPTLGHWGWYCTITNVMCIFV